MIRQRYARSAKEVLIAAKWMIENVGWCKHVAVKRDKDHKPVAFCALGAIINTHCEPNWNGKEGYGFQHLAKISLSRAIGTHESIGWGFNDLPTTKKKDVLDAFDRAIAICDK